MRKLCIVVLMAIFCMPVLKANAGYYETLYQMEEVSRGAISLEDVSTEVIVCTSQKKLEPIVIALPDNSGEMLGLVLWEGEILNLYPAGDTYSNRWAQQWPINHTLSIEGLTEAKEWLNNFNEFSPREYVWWDNNSTEDIVISEDFDNMYATIMVGGKMYYAFQRWGSINTVEEIARNSVLVP